MDSLMDLHVMRTPKFKNYVFSVWFVCMCACDFGSVGILACRDFDRVGILGCQDFDLVEILGCRDLVGWDSGLSGLYSDPHREIDIL